MKRKLIITAVVLLLLALPLLAWRIYLAHVINRELADIRAVGLPVNGEELNRWYPAVPDNQNAALVLEQAFALLKTTYSDHRAEEILKLQDKFPRRADQLTAEQVELIRWHLETNLPALMKAREALKLPSSRYPVDFSRLFSTELPHLAHLANLGILNQCSAALAILAERNDDATGDIVSGLELARTLDHEPCLISQLVRLKMIRMAFAMLEQRANAGRFSEAEIVILIAAFSQTQTTNVTERALIGERSMTIPYFHMTRAEANKINPPKAGDDSRKDSPAPYNGPAILRLIGYYELDYATYLRGMSKALALMSNSPPDNLRAGGYLAHAGEESNQRQRVISGRTFSVYSGAASRENEGVAHQRISLAALAVESFRNETGRLPENLQELVPKYFEKVPEDPFTGLELEYRRLDAGYVIHSVGPDREDSGGLGKMDKQHADDLSFTVEQ